jgi:hypothetical protein
MWVRKGRLQPVHLCRRLLFDPAEVQRFVAANTRPRLAEVRND